MLTETQREAAKCPACWLLENRLLPNPQKRLECGASSGPLTHVNAGNARTYDQERASSYMDAARRSATRLPVATAVLTLLCDRYSPA